MYKVLLLSLLLAAGQPALAAPAASICGPLTNGFGPFDYRKGQGEFASNLYLVEMAHFTPEVEAGVKGNTGTVGADIDYTLRAFPNHVRALTAMSTVGARLKAVKIPGAKYPVECYFERAIRFAPDDGAARASYGSFLFSKGNVEGALKMFIRAAELEPDNAGINYNLGLAYFKSRDHAKANLHAQRAYALGFPLPGLKNLLVAAKQWDEQIDHGIKPKPAQDAADEGAPASAAPPAAQTPAKSE